MSIRLISRILIWNPSAPIGARLARSSSPILPIGRGPLQHADFRMLMPLTWAAGCALGESSEKAVRLLLLLDDRYHLEPDLLQRFMTFDWREFEGVEFDGWEVFLKERLLYVPMF